MKTPFVSILVPVYNVGDCLERCLESLVRQTLSNIEIICVDDGSTDNSAKILKKYRKRDRRISIIHKENGGLPSARNAGINAARGEYVGFVDSDDYVEERMFQRLYETARSHDSEVVICGAEIFPEKPHASDWLYKCLSPEYRHYEKFEPSILFDNSYTTPFLWRTLIKRDLLEEYNLRLDEDILLGEDKLFQSKVYPKAKNITVIPDKLYHYGWYREGSMMSQDVYHVSGKKMQAHWKMVHRVAEVLTEDFGEAEMSIQFLKWSIPFLYSDFIYQQAHIKKKLANEMVKVWVNAGYYLHKWKLPDWINEQFTYFYEAARMDDLYAKISVIIPASGECEYIEESLKSILTQSIQEVECIIVNSGASNRTYSILHQYLFKDKRVRLYNTEGKKSYAECLNYGISLAEGEYLAFCEPDGWYADKNALMAWYYVASGEDADICAGIKLQKDNIQFTKLSELDGESIINECSADAFLQNDFHHIIYRKQFLEDKEILFKDASIVSGFPFLVRAYLEARKKVFINRLNYVIRYAYRQDWISTEKCEKVLEAMEEIMEYSVEKQNGAVQARVLALLNGDYLKKIIVNNTRAYCMPPERCPNGENSQFKTIKYLYRIMQLVDSDLLEEAGYEVTTSYINILWEVMKERQKFIGDLSVRYQ